MILTSSTIKFIRSLHDKNGRDAEKLFIVEGEKMVSEAISSGYEILNVIRSAEIGESVMKRISALSSPSPVLAVVRRPEYILPEIKAGGFYLALDGISDPGNMGTILRIADWYGVDAVFAAGHSVDIYNPKTVQSTMGAVFRVKYGIADIAEICSRDDVDSFATFLSGENIYSANLESAMARVLVIGNESRGISEKVGEACKRRLTIPSFVSGGACSESLNAAIACAISVSEFKRRCL